MKNMFKRFIHVSMFMFTLFAINILGGCKQSNDKSSVPDPDNPTPPSSELVITKIIVGNQTKEATQIVKGAVVEFAIPTAVSEVPVKVETNDKDAQITFVPELQDEKIVFPTFEKPEDLVRSVKVIVEKGSKKIEQTIMLKKIIQDIGIYGGRKNGKMTFATRDERLDILEHKNVTVTVSGPYADILASTHSATWTSFKINGKECPVSHDLEYASSSFAKIQMGNRGETIPVEIVIETNPIGADGNVQNTNLAREVFNFNITRADETVDLPLTSLFISGKDVIYGAVNVNDMYVGLINGPKPIFDAGEPASIVIEAEDVLKTVNIDGQNVNVQQKEVPISTDTPSKTKTIWYAESSVAGVKPSGKEITCVMEPNDAQTYHNTTWRFKLVYKEKEKIIFDYVINGKDQFDLGQAFTIGIANDTNPLLKVDGEYLNLKLSSKTEIKQVDVNGTVISGNKIKKITEKGKTVYVCLHSQKLNAGQEQVNVSIAPKDEGAYLPASMKFKIEGKNTKEKITPKFEEISGNTQLPQDFIDKLGSTDKPTYHVLGSQAKIVVSIPEYQAEFLCKEVLVNGKKQELEYVSDYVNPRYKFTKQIDINPTTPTEVSIKFVAKDDMATEVNWNFFILGDGKKPAFPQTNIFSFTINGIGSLSNPFTDEFKKHLTDGTNPEFLFDGSLAKAKLTFESTKKDSIKKIEFHLDNEIKKDVTSLSTEGSFYVASYDFTLSDTNDHVAQVIIYPKDEANYSSLKYSFTLKSSGNKTPPPLNFQINYKGRPNGYEQILNAEKVTLSVQTIENVMERVDIGPKGNEKYCLVKTWQDSQGVTVYEAKIEVLLPLDKKKPFVIKVKPKDTNQYGEAVCEYNLQGTRIPKTNAKFLKNHKNEPDIVSNIEWNPGVPNSFRADNYGAKKVTITARTQSPRAQVRLQFLDINDNPIDGTKKFLTNGTQINAGTHVSEKIFLYQNKPTKVKVWVVAEDYSTEDPIDGVWTFTYNPVKLFWGYEDKPNISDYTTKADGEIQITKDGVNSADKKVYLIFGMWDEIEGYTVDNSALPNGQTSFTKFGKSEGLQYYKTSVEISELIKDNPTVDHLEGVLKIKRGETLCFTYKVQIKL